MLKKLLILPLIWVFFWLTAFASATDYNFSVGWDWDYNPKTFSVSSPWIINLLSQSNSDCWFVIFDSSSNVICSTMFNSNWSIVFWTCDWVNFSVWDYSISSEWSSVCSSLSFSIGSSSSDNNSSSSLVPTIPSSFTSWLTSLVSNFGATIVNWLPTIILVALGIYAIFALFRVVRWYSRSSFRW